MKTWTLLVSWLIACATTMASALPKESVPADAKWLLHLNVTEFQASRIGQTVAKEFLDEAWQAKLAALKPLLGADLDWRKLESLTVYGTDFKQEQNAVMLIKTDSDTQQSLVTALRKLSKGGDQDAGEQVEETVGDTGSIFTFKSGILISTGKDRILAVSKHRPALEKANEVLAGKGANLKSGSAFADWPDHPQGFFFIALADGFGAADHLPPQARILQQADGGQLALGENADRLLVSLSLHAKSTEACQQIQQVIQGLQALAVLSQNENRELSDLVNAVKVTSKEKFVTVDFSYPVEKAFQTLAQKAGKAKTKEGKKAGKAKKNREAEVTE
jgi:hypothetical protein